MGLVRFEREYPAAVAASRMFKAFVDSPNLLPKVAPQAFKSIEVLEGDGGVGTVTLWTFPDGGDYKQVKHRIDALDKDNFTSKYTLYDGDGILTLAEKWVYDVKFEASGNGGCAYKFTVEVYVKDGEELKEEYVKDAEEKASGLYKVLEAHLVANPDLYA